MVDNHYKDYYLALEGSRGVVVDQLRSMLSEAFGDSAYVTKEDVEQLIKLLERYQPMLGDDESFQSNRARPTNGQAFILEEQHLYINVRRITIALLVYLLGERLNIPLGMLLGFAGVAAEERAILFLNELGGELCILLETARCGRAGANEYLMQQANPAHECVNNQYTCRYRQDGLCTCTPQRTKEILNYLHKKGALKTRGQRYCYNSDFL